MRRNTSPVSITLILLISVLSWAAPLHAATPRILMVGDSWAWFMWLNRSLQHAMQRAGLGEYEEVGQYTTIPGSTSKQWTDPKWLESIKKEYDRNPTIDIVHISLGGNGFLRGWNKDMPDDKRDEMFRTITNEIETVARYCLALSPNMKVAICGYDYVNEPRRNSNIQDLNEAGMILAGMKRDMCARNKGMQYIQSYGLMQYHFGFAPDFAPKAVPRPGEFPGFKPWPGGKRDHGNPPEAMLDQIHLSVKGYEYLADNCVEACYKKWLTEGAKGGRIAKVEAATK